MINGKEITTSGIVETQSINHLICKIPSNYDYEVWMSDVNALELATSTQPISTFVRLRKTGQIKLNANGKENEKLLAYEKQLLAKDNEPVPEWIREMFGHYLK